eukprot:4747405-Amphidinium_carterae.2
MKGSLGRYKCIFGLTVHTEVKVLLHLPRELQRSVGSHVTLDCMMASGNGASCMAWVVDVPKVRWHYH